MGGAIPGRGTSLPSLLSGGVGVRPHLWDIEVSHWSIFHPYKRYSPGVCPVAFLNMLKKCSAELYPNAAATSFIEAGVSLSICLARCIFSSSWYSLSTRPLPASKK